MDVHRGECFFAAEPKANSTTVAAYFHDLATHAHSQGATKRTVLLDRNSTHGPKLRQALADLQPLIPVVFLHLAAYSPRLNPAEYLLHLIRLKLLHHAASTQHLAQVQQRLEKTCTKKSCPPPNNSSTCSHSLSKAPPEMTDASPERK